MAHNLKKKNIVNLVLICLVHVLVCVQLVFILFDCLRKQVGTFFSFVYSVVVV